MGVRKYWLENEVKSQEPHFFRRSYYLRSTIGKQDLKNHQYNGRDVWLFDEETTKAAIHL